MKTVFGGAIALALVLIQPLWAEDPKTDKTDGDQKRILAGANEDPGQEIAPMELKTCKSLLTMSKKASERAAKLQQMAAERLRLIVKDYADTPEGKEAARLLASGHSAPLPSNLDSTALNVTAGNIISEAARGLRNQTEAVTRAEGPSALLMELVDLDDPVEIGVDTGYAIRVTNTGSKIETNVQLVCVMPDKMEFRGAQSQFRGAQSSAFCNFHLQGKEVVFELPKLAPQADVLFRVNVRGIAPGDLRFRARLTADGLADPVLKEESTKVYGDSGLPK
jgi:Domain of unknown function DUF11